MSIREWIFFLAGSKLLHVLVPKAPGAAVRRVLLVTTRLKEELETSGDYEWEDRMGRLQADLETFVTEEELYPKYLFLLYPAEDAIWEIRSVSPNPSIRVLGLFAEKDIYVATHLALREDLGGWQSREWKKTKREAGAKWRALFHQYSPMRTIDVTQVITGACNGKYFREN